MGSGNDSGSDSNPCPRGYSSPYMVGATACATVPPHVALLLHFYWTLTAKMEDFIAKLKQFSKLDFQSKREMMNNGRPMPELKGLLQTTGQKITRSTSHIQSQIALN